MKKLLTLLPIFLIVSLVATGCQPEKEDPTEEPTSEQTSTTDPEEEPIVKLSDADDVGPELRHDAYRYYGLGNQKAFVYELDQSTGMVEEGSQEFAYQGMVDGVPTYKLIRKGSLSMLGEETYTLGADGISMVSTTMGDLSGPALTVPADLSVGAKWSSTQSITRADGQVVEMVIDHEVTGTETVETDAGSFETLVIDSSGTINVGDAKNTFTGKVYLAEGTGHIKLETHTKSEDGEEKHVFVTLKAIN